MYPEITLEHVWADEDIGVNCGRRVYKDGNVISEYIPESTKEAMELATSVWEYDLSDLNLSLNKAGTGYISTAVDTYELIGLFGRPMLFADERLSDADIPAELYVNLLLLNRLHNQINSKRRQNRTPLIIFIYCNLHS